MVLLLCALIVGSSSAWGADETYASWEFTSDSYPANKTNFSATGGTCTQSTFYLNGSGSQWNDTKGYAFTSVTSITITLKLESALPAGSKLTFSADTYYNKANNAPMKGFDLTASENNGEYTTTGLNVTSLSLSTSSATKTCIYTTQNALAAGETIAIKYTGTGKAGVGQGYFGNIIIKGPEVVPSGTTAAPTISGTTPFLENTTVTITNAASADGANIYYTLNGSDPTTTTSATCFAYSDAFQISSTTTVKAIAKKSTDTNASSVVSKTFTKVTPMTVTDALTAIAALADNGKIEDQCVTGIVSTAGGSLNDGTITYSVSVDGTKTNELYVYNGKGLNGADFASADDIAVGDEVVIYGTLKKYKNGSTITPEFTAGNYLLSKVRKPVPSFSLDIDEATLEAYKHETADATLTTNTDGAISCESSNADVATVALKSAGVYTITAQSEGSATITIKSAASANYQAAEATVSVTVTDTRADAGISFAEDEEEITWGDAFTGQVLTNTNSVAVSWSSTDETVATVNSTGVVNVLKAGSTTIKANFDGDATYKAAVASYDLTVNKADAGLSYTTTSFDIMLNDDSFVAPTLNNPNSLTGITYLSNNEAVALVDEDTGELAYDETVTGTAKITATFAGNDWYESGSANYTINIVDPTVKGSKYNPYTVEEVINGTATGNGIYVKGFIVGEYVGSATAPKTSGFTTNANIAIAAPFTTSPTASGSIPVALPTDALKNVWGCKITKGALLGYEVLIKGNAQTYFEVNGIKSTSEVSAVSVPATITTAKYATFASAYATDFSETGITAYTATDNGETVRLNEITSGQVPANTPVVLWKDGGATINVPIISSAEAVGDNDLEVSDGTNATGDDIYVLANKSKGVGFYPWTSASSLSAGKVFLRIAGGSAREFIGFEEGETTAINAALMNNERMNNEVYNLNGQRVAQPTKGLYIVNGKKVIIK